MIILSLLVLSINFLMNRAENFGNLQRVYNKMKFIYEEMISVTVLPETKIINLKLISKL